MPETPSPNSSSTTRSRSVVQDEGTVKADQGTVDYDRVQLAYCHIVAPITGRVGLRLVDPGNTIFSGSNSTLVVITQLQPITVVFNVSEDDLPQVHAQLNGGHKLQVTLSTAPTTSRSNPENSLLWTTRSTRLRGPSSSAPSFPITNFSLFPNQFVNARLLVKTLHSATLVPSAAVQHNGTAAFVTLCKPITRWPCSRSPRSPATISHRGTGRESGRYRGYQWIRSSRERRDGAGPRTERPAHNASARR